SDLTPETLAPPRPPTPIQAMFSLLLRFCPRSSAGAPATAARAPPTNSRRVIPRIAFFFFITLPSFMTVARASHSREPTQSSYIARSQKCDDEVRLGQPAAGARAGQPAGLACGRPTTGAPAFAI